MDPSDRRALLRPRLTPSDLALRGVARWDGDEGNANGELPPVVYTSQNKMVSTIGLNLNVRVNAANLLTHVAL